MTRLKIYISIILVVITIAVQAQQCGIIKGRVLDTNNLSMPGAAVVIETINKGAITNNYGYYTITGIQEGPYGLSVSYIGFYHVKK